MNIEFNIWATIGTLALALITILFFFEKNWIGLIGVIIFSLLAYNHNEKQKEKDRGAK